MKTNQPVYVHNQQLTDEFVIVPIDIRYDGYVANTKDGSDFEVKLSLESLHSFLFSTKFGTSPMITTFNRRRDSSKDYVFYAKGTGILQIMYSS